MYVHNSKTILKFLIDKISTSSFLSSLLHSTLAHFTSNAGSLTTWIIQEYYAPAKKFGPIYIIFCADKYSVDCSGQ